MVEKEKDKKRIEREEKKQIEKIIYRRRQKKQRTQTF